MKKRKIKSSWKQVALDLRSMVFRLFNGLCTNKLSFIIILMQAITIYRVEKLGDKIDALGMGVAQSLVILYMNIVLMMNEMAGILEKVLAIVMGDPA